MKKCYIFIFLLLALLMPIVINIILLCYNPIEWLVPVVGKQELWLSFWGSYIGAIASTCMAYFILHKTLKENRKENELNRRFERNENLKTELIELVCSISFKQITSPVVKGRSFNKSLILNRCVEMIDSADRIRNKVLLVCEEMKEANSFRDSFDAYIDDVWSLHQAVMKLKRDDGSEYIDDSSKTPEFIQSYKNLEDKRLNENEKLFQNMGNELMDLIDNLNLVK